MKPGFEWWTFPNPAGEKLTDVYDFKQKKTDVEGEKGVVINKGLPNQMDKFSENLVNRDKGFDTRMPLAIAMANVGLIWSGLALAIGTGTVIVNRDLTLALLTASHNFIDYATGEPYKNLRFLCGQNGVRSTAYWAAEITMIRIPDQAFHHVNEHKRVNYHYDFAVAKLEVLNDDREKYNKWF